MPIREMRPEDQQDLVELTVQADPTLGTEGAVDLVSGTGRTRYAALVAHGADGALVGWALLSNRPVLPPDCRLVSIFVQRSQEGLGLGSSLRSALRERLDDHVTQLRAAVADSDERSLAVARHWGFEVELHSIISALPLLVALPQPDPPPGVTLENCSGMRFADEPAVEQMLRVSQTNPEAGRGVRMTLTGLRAMAGADGQAVAVLARVDGRPAAITFGVASGSEVHLVYTGVDPAYRGRGLGRLVKCLVHLEAQAVGATECRTDNEEHNAGIRHVNASLGYVKQSGRYLLRRSWPG